MEQIGIYEQLVTKLIEKKLDRKRFYIGERKLEAEEAAVWLSRFLSRIVIFALDSIPNKSDKLEKQIELANELICWLREKVNDDIFEENLIDTQGKIITALLSLENPIATDLGLYAKSIFPITGLSQSELFSGANAGISLESELKREILSADKIYWLVSFIKWTGLRIFKDELEEFDRQGKTIQVITTSYMGATDAKAVEFLAGLRNAQVKLSYNVNQERLHAKSYIFMRNSGFHTGYVGSSNLSHSALTSGLEWNLKITTQEIPHIINKTISTFDTYWESADFEQYKNGEESQERLRRALSQERQPGGNDFEPILEVRPYPHQLTILEKLMVERETHCRYRNLVVAATGTGKTLISAFDFQRFCKENPSAKFLYVAHRVEILQQAQSAYQSVLKDRQFGELWVGAIMPGHYRQLFASVQVLKLNLKNMNLSPNYYDYVVVDEAHHITASSYRDVVEHFSPKILLGLTATPERMDGSNILEDFGNVIAAEIRLPEAINQRNLCPFQYFGIDDGTDLTHVAWKAGRYDIAELSNVYSNSDARVSRVIMALRETVTDIKKIKALAFCVDKSHASFMAMKFSANGIAAEVLTSDNSHERNSLRKSLRDGNIKILCVVDIFNEGVDVPEIDTLLFLRPTESLTVFLQQLGRGLRLPSNFSEKQCCTVLDFVGNARPEYDFSTKFRALVGKSNISLVEEVENGFPHLPLGCGIKLEKRTQAIVLNNIRKAVNKLGRLTTLIFDFRQNTDLPLTLINFLRINPNVDLEDIYKVNIGAIGGWTVLAGSMPEEGEIKIFDAYRRAIDKHLLLCNSKIYLEFLLHLCTCDFDIRSTPSNESLALMAHYTFWNDPGPSYGFSNIAESLKSLSHPKLKLELVDVLTLLIQRIGHRETDMEFSPSHCIKVHSRYSRQQILAGFGASGFDRKSPSREGVLFLPEKNIELLFVTLDKCEKSYSPTTLYHDFAISPTKFHWQTQNNARPDTGKGLSYIDHKATNKTILLFVREKNKDENGRTMGFVNFGEVEYSSHTGSQPMNITWNLKTPMPSQMWHDAAKLAVG